MGKDNEELKNDLRNAKTYEIEGLAEELTDPSGVLLITRDPLHHAELFSKYLAQHERIHRQSLTTGYWSLATHNYPPPISRISRWPPPLPVTESNDAIF